MGRYSYGYGWRPYVSVAERRSNAAKEMVKLRKRGMKIQPIEIEGRKIAATFWGLGWCDHMESLGDFDNRLPRGRTYVRNGSVCHLAIERGKVTAIVSGSELYHVKIKIDLLPKAKWNAVKSRCAGQIGSLLDLLAGKLSDGVMQVVCDPQQGLFPDASEIRLDCSCPDYAYMCKHVAAVLYGVGARLDERPELLFLLRGVDHEEMVATSAEQAVARATESDGKRRTLAEDELADVFGIELDDDDAPPAKPASRSSRKTAKKTSVKTKVLKKASKKKVTKTKASKKAAPTKQAKVVKKKAVEKQAKAVKKKVASKRAAKKKGARKK